MCAGPSCDGQDLDRAFLEIRLFGDGVGGVQRYLVDQLAGVEPRYEDDTARHAVAAARLNAGAYFAPTRDNTDLLPLIEPEAARVISIHEQARAWKCLVQFRYAQGHRPGMPVLQHPAGHEPHIVLFIRTLRRGLVRHAKDDGSAIRAPVELYSLPFPHIGVVTFPVAPARFLAVHHGPAQAAHLVIGVEWRKVMAMAAAELGIFLEQAFLDVEAERLGFVIRVVRIRVGKRKTVYLAIAEKDFVERLAAVVRIGVEDLRRPDLIGDKALGKFNDLPQVGSRFASGADELMPEMSATLGVAICTLLLYPHRRGQDQEGAYGNAERR